MGARHGAEQLDARFEQGLDLVDKRLGGGAGDHFRTGPEMDGRHVRRRREVERLAGGQLLAVEGVVVLAHGELEHRVERGVGLDDDAAGEVAAAGAAGHLDQQLEGALAGAEVGAGAAPCRRP